MGFINRRSMAVKSSFGQELIRLQSSEKRATTDVKKQQPTDRKPAKTLATSTTPPAAIATKQQPTTTPDTNTTQQRKKVCRLCKEEHLLSDCNSFKEMTLEKRSTFCKEKGLCFNCFNYGHRIHQCRTPPRCDECKGKHHTLLHDPSRKANTFVADHPLKPAIDRRLGRPLPHQLSNLTRANPSPINLSPEGRIRYYSSFPKAIP